MSLVGMGANAEFSGFAAVERYAGSGGEIPGSDRHTRRVRRVCRIRYFIPCVTSWNWTLIASQDLWRHGAASRAWHGGAWPRPPCLGRLCSGPSLRGRGRFGGGTHATIHHRALEPKRGALCAWRQGLIARAHLPYGPAPVSIVKGNLVGAVGEGLHYMAAVPAAWITRPPGIDTRAGTKPSMRL